MPIFWAKVGRVLGFPKRVLGFGVPPRCVERGTKPTIFWFSLPYLVLIFLSLVLGPFKPSLRPDFPPEKVFFHILSSPSSTKAVTNKMKFAHTFSQVLQEEDFPADWQAAAIRYRELKKCIKKVQSELLDLGLTVEVLKGLVEEAEGPVFKYMFDGLPSLSTSGYGGKWAD